MVAFAAHGGACCGMMHLYSFGNDPEARTYDAILRNYCLAKDSFERWIKQMNVGQTAEVCLTDGQMMKWAPILKQAGFKLVHRKTRLVQLPANCPLQ